MVYKAHLSPTNLGVMHPRHHEIKKENIEQFQLLTASYEQYK
jgi:hypothetical protein